MADDLKQRAEEMQKRLRSWLRAQSWFWMDDRIAAADLIAALVETNERLQKAGDRLSICAQTTGGTAGHDKGLVEAITGWQEARAALNELGEGK